MFLPRAPDETDAEQDAMGPYKCSAFSSNSELKSESGLDGLLIGDVVQLPTKIAERLH